MILGLSSKFSGSRVMAAPISRSFSSGTAVSTGSSSSGQASDLRIAGTMALVATFDFCSALLSFSSNLARKARTSSGVMSPNLTRWPKKMSLIGGWSSMAEYISGWVKRGSSPSLWPWRR